MQNCCLGEIIAAGVPPTSHDWQNLSAAAAAEGGREPAHGQGQQAAAGGGREPAHGQGQQAAAGKGREPANGQGQQAAAGGGRERVHSGSSCQGQQAAAEGERELANCGNSCQGQLLGDCSDWQGGGEKEQEFHHGQLKARFTWPSDGEEEEILVPDKSRFYESLPTWFAWQSLAGREETKVELSQRPEEEEDDCRSREPSELHTTAAQGGGINQSCHPGKSVDKDLDGEEREGVPWDEVDPLGLVAALRQRLQQMTIDLERVKAAADRLHDQMDESEEPAMAVTSPPPHMSSSSDATSSGCQGPQARVSLGQESFLAGNTSGDLGSSRERRPDRPENSSESSPGRIGLGGGSHATKSSPAADTCAILSGVDNERLRHVSDQSGKFPEPSIRTPELSSQLPNSSTADRPGSPVRRYLEAKPSLL